MPPIREHSITRITPRIRLVRGWKNRRITIPQHKAQREGGDLAQTGDNSKKPQMDNENFWRRWGSENCNLDKVSSKFEEKFKKTFLENQTGFHQPPKQEVIAHQHGLHRDQRYPHQNCFEKYFGNLVMKSFNKQTYAVLLPVKQVAIMVPGWSTTSSLSSLCTSTPPTSSTQDAKGSIPDPASIECESEDRQLRGDP